MKKHARLRRACFCWFAAECIWGYRAASGYFNPERWFVNVGIARALEQIVILDRLARVLLREHRALAAYLAQAEVCPVCGGLDADGELVHKADCPFVRAAAEARKCQPRR